MYPLYQLCQISDKSSCLLPWARVFRTVLFRFAGSIWTDHPFQTSWVFRSFDDWGMRSLERILAVFEFFAVFFEAASQVYSMALHLSTSERCFPRIIKMSGDPVRLTRFRAISSMFHILAGMRVKPPTDSLLAGLCAILLFVGNWR
jgi:hypothetical protein